METDRHASWFLNGLINFRSGKSGRHRPGAGPERCCTLTSAYTPRKFRRTTKVQDSTYNSHARMPPRDHPFYIITRQLDFSTFCLDSSQGGKRAPSRSDEQGNKATFLRCDDLDGGHGPRFPSWWQEQNPRGRDGLGRAAGESQKRAKHDSFGVELMRWEIGHDHVDAHLRPTGCLRSCLSHRHGSRSKPLLLRLPNKLTSERNR